MDLQLNFLSFGGFVVRKKENHIKKPDKAKSRSIKSRSRLQDDKKAELVPILGVHPPHFFTS